MKTWIDKIETQWLERQASLTIRSNTSLWELAKQNKLLLFLGAMFSFFFINTLLFGWSHWLFPDLTKPVVYGGDVSFVFWEIKRILEGSLWENLRSGYPFGSNFYDYLLCDSANLAILKLFGILTGTYYGGFNLYTVMAFPLIFIFSFLVLRAFRMRTSFSFIASLLFTFAPFHCIRLLGHPYYGWYFVIPLYFLYAKKIFSLDQSLWPLNKPKKILLPLFSLIFLSCFGVYYAVFGVITMLVAGLLHFMKFKTRQGFILSLILSSMVVLGVGLNITPNLIHKYTNGPNPEKAPARYPFETELYGLKLTPLLLPSDQHRIKKLRPLSQKYQREFPPATETHVASHFGLISSVGFLLVILFIFSAICGKPLPGIELPVALIFAFLLISTNGGFNSMFALFISPLIRGWNRISIFISFATLLALFLFLQNSNLLERFLKRKRTVYLFLLALLAIGLFDQIPKYNLYPIQQQYQEDKIFISKIEELLPGGAIYQLPYMGFPEYGSLLNMPDYAHLIGFLHSNTLRWSHGGMKGRKGDRFYRNLAKKPIKKQLAFIQKLGFNGIYVDRRGFADYGEQLTKELNQLLGSPTLVSTNNLILFYKINPSALTST